MRERVRVGSRKGMRAKKGSYLDERGPNVTGPTDQDGFTVSFGGGAELCHGGWVVP